jgi:hypothetical protein
MTSRHANAGAGNSGVRESDLASRRVNSGSEYTCADHRRQRGGKASRQKGNRAERAVVKFLQDRGFAAERIPLSGAAGGSFVGDIPVPVLGVDRVVEVKCRAALVVVRMSFAAEVAAKAGAR